MISDEIRELAGEAGIYSNACGKLRELADRIDRELVELPKDRDGAPIHIGDTVYLESGPKADVKSIAFTKDENSFVFTVCGTGLLASPCNLSHERSDSLERIADELEAAEKWCDIDGNYGTGISSVRGSTFKEWSDRIRKLAKEDK